MQRVIQYLKKAHYIGIALLLALTSTAATTQIAAAWSGSGAGTQANPYLITSCAQIKEIDDSLANLDAHYRLTADLNCTADGNSIMVNNNGSSYFSGVFDGQGHTITIDIDTTDNGAFYGLFSQTQHAGSDTTTIRNLTVSGTVNTPNSTVIGGGSVGGLVGKASATSLINTHSTVDVTAGAGAGGLVGNFHYGGRNVEFTNSSASGTVSGFINVGGLAGRIQTNDTDAGTPSNVTLNNLSASGAITSYSVSGGLIGLLSTGKEKPLTNSHATGNVSATGSGIHGVGGLIGSLAGKVEKTYATGNVTSGYLHNTGGLIGEMIGMYAGEPYTSAIESYATGDVTSNGNFVGGFIGRLSGGTVLRSFATGDVLSDSNSQYVGGFAGSTESNAVIKDSYAHGDAYGYGYVGGFTGYATSNSKAIYSYSLGSATAFSTPIGGFIGALEDGADTVSTFWDTETSGTITSDAGIGRTTAEMKTMNTFINGGNAWDFVSVWRMGDLNDGYPCLAWQSACAPDHVTLPIHNSSAIEIQNAAPNDGDANNDGILDSTQFNVTSFINPATGSYVVIEVDETCSFTSASTLAEDQRVKDSGYDYRAGFVDFTATCPAENAEFKVFQYDADPTGLVLRKFNTNTNAYFNVPGATLTAEEIGGKKVTIATYTIEDNGILDLDPTIGTIKDPVGLGNPVVGVPNTGFKRQ